MDTTHVLELRLQSECLYCNNAMQVPQGIKK